MTPTRWTTLLAFIVGSLGLATLISTDSIWVAIGGAAAVVASALILFRHFWRLAQRNRQEAMERFSALASQLEEVRKTGQVLSTRLDAVALGILEEVAQIHIEVTQQQLDANRHATELKRGLERASTHRERILGQIDGITAIYSALPPSRPYPQFGGWALGGDTARRYVSLIFARKPGIIIEVGSGLSTILAAKVLEAIGGDGRVIALEHDAHWAEVTRSTLTEHGLLDRADVHHAPLVEVQITSESWQWYDLTGIDLPRQAEILFVDGPPKATGEMARYPALPMLLDRLTPDAVILLDDGSRPDELAIVDRWIKEFPDLVSKRYQDAKGAIEIRRIGP